MPADNLWDAPAADPARMPVIWLNEPLATLPREGKLFWLGYRSGAKPEYTLAVSTRTGTPPRNNTSGLVRYADGTVEMIDLAVGDKDADVEKIVAQRGGQVLGLAIHPAATPSPIFG